MSTATHAALEDAIRAHVLDGGGEPAIITDYVVLVASQGLDDSVTSYQYACRWGTPAHVITGLIRHFLRRLEHAHSIEEDR